MQARTTPNQEENSEANWAMCLTPSESSVALHQSQTSCTTQTVALGMKFCCRSPPACSRGSVTFRNSISATLSALPHPDDKSTVTSNSKKGIGGEGSGVEDCSIGSLAKRNQHNLINTEDLQ